MSRTLTIDPVTRIEGHAKVHIEIDDNNDVSGAYMQVLEFRGFEKFVEGMQVEMMPTITSRICGTCPHAHHLVSAKTVDKVFSAQPPPAAVLLRQLLNFGSIIHSHAIHFFALAGPDLLLGLDAPPEKRNIVELLNVYPELAKQALRLRSLGQKITELIGGRGTHPVTCVVGGVSVGLDVEKRDKLRLLADEALELAQIAFAAGEGALQSQIELVSAFPLSVHNMGTVNNGKYDLYDGDLGVVDSEGGQVASFNVEQYKDYIIEEVLPYSYSKQALFQDTAGALHPYRVGPLARLNCVTSLDTPRAGAAFKKYKAQFGESVNLPVLGHYARLIEMLYCAEKAVAVLEDETITSKDIKAEVIAKPKSAIAHIEAPRGVLIHDYKVDEDGLMRGANLVVATGHNMSSINSSIKSAAKHFMDRPDDELLNGVEFAIRCYDPCLSCATHNMGKMPMVVTIGARDKIVRQVRR